MNGVVCFAKRYFKITMLRSDNSVPAKRLCEVGECIFNRWLVVDVSWRWRLVSQVRLVLHITLLQGDSSAVLAESAVLSRCIILLSMQHANFNPSWLWVSCAAHLVISHPMPTSTFHASSCPDTKRSISL